MKDGQPIGDHAIPQGHEKMVWLFSAQTDLASLEALKGDGLADVLGLWSEPDPAFVECFDAQTMSEYGLAKYIGDANGMEISAEQAATLDALEGTLCLIYSKALAPGEQLFAPEPPLSFVGRFGTPPAIPPMGTLTSESAKGQLAQGKPGKSDARMSGLVATAVLVFLALFVVAFVLVGG